MVRTRYPQRERARRVKVTYRDSSTESESDLVESEAQDSSLPKRQKLSKNAIPRGSGWRSRKKPASRTSQHRPRVLPAATPLAPLKIISDNLIPLWTTLPFDILFSIFFYASYPLRDDFYRPTASRSWLVRVARTCKAFAGPALSALYETPPLLFSSDSHRLLELLETDGAASAFKYAPKVKVLDLDVESTLVYTTTGRGHLDLSVLVSKLPTLRKIDISRPINRPPFRDSRYSPSITRWSKWHYPLNLFRSLQDNGCKLHSWRFDEELFGPASAGNLVDRDTQMFEILSGYLQSEALQGLQHLTLSRFERLFTPALQPIIANLLSQFISLRSLDFESPLCDEWPILGLLPRNLHHLSFINCPTLFPEDFRLFLASHGGQLKSLTVSHARRLDLSFLVDLKTSCPQLQFLKVDCALFSHLEFSASMVAIPGYQHILSDTDIPTWPSTLQTIEMLHLRKLTSTAAQLFFDSLIESAPELPSLRKLVIKAILDMSWRDRAGFRESRISELKKVFLRRPKPPNPHLASLRAFRVWTTGRDTIRPASSNNESFENLNLDLGSPEKVEVAAAEGEATITRKSRRILRQEVEIVKSSLGRFSSSGSSTHGSHNNMALNASPKTRKSNFVQGLCDVVEISIDNMRPREKQFHESDFMDSEASGDEDWTVDVEEPSTYAF